MKSLYNFVVTVQMWQNFVISSVKSWRQSWSKVRAVNQIGVPCETVSWLSWSVLMISSSDSWMR